MITTDELIQRIRDAATSFDGKQYEDARQRFISHFPENEIRKLTPEQYNGGEEEDSFCYNLLHAKNLPFSIPNDTKFGKKPEPKNDTQFRQLIEGIAGLIEDVRNELFVDLKQRHELKSISEAAIIKILSIYFPDKFISIGEEFTITLLSRILGIEQTDDLIECNHLCYEKLVRLEPEFALYKYNQLGSAIWDFLSPQTREGFNEWLKEESSPNSCKQDYSRCIELLSYYKKENLFSIQTAASDIDKLYDETLQHQKDNGGTLYYSKPSYGKGGHYSAATLSLAKYLRSIQEKNPLVDTPSTTETQTIDHPLSKQQMYSHNIILYGPPGTGKTYNSIRYAISIIEGIDRRSINDGDGTYTVDGQKKLITDAFNEFVDNKRLFFITFHQSLSYEDFVEGLKPEPDEKGENILYKPVAGVFKKICEEARDKDVPYVLIIDEINRGNIAQIFGELITLIEEDKREGNDVVPRCILPYSHKSFSVPNNLYIIGTMNTADRSVEALDTALRRRFCFIEMLPNAELVSYRRDCFERINQRIAILKDSEHLIGHSYFIGIKKEAELIRVFRNNIIPLLQEYFYGDNERIRMVIGNGFFHNLSVDQEKLFPGYKGDIDIPLNIWTIWNDEDWEKCEKDPKLFSKALEQLMGKPETKEESS